MSNPNEDTDYLCVQHTHDHDVHATPPLIIRLLSMLLNLLSKYCSICIKVTVILLNSGPKAKE